MQLCGYPQTYPDLGVVGNVLSWTGLDRQTAKSSAFTELIARVWTWLDSVVVEAGGIEPPSEDLPASATTRLFRDLISSPGRARTSCPSTSRLKFWSVAQSANRELLAH